MLAALGTVLLFVPAASYASVTTCELDTGAGTLNVGITGTGRVDLKRSGDRIRVRDKKGGKVTCSGGVPTVNNIDSIAVNADPENIDGLNLDLAGGQFAPGKTPEANGASEIEISIDEIFQLAVLGGPKRDVIREREALFGVDLNFGQDSDVDLTSTPGVPPFAASIHGRGGADLLRVDQRGELTTTLLGGRGRDSLRGSNGFDYLGGGPGRDTLVANGGDDVLSGDSGADVLFAGGGLDYVVSQDNSRDRINCGPGHYDTVYLDSHDRTRSCETLSLHHTRIPPPSEF